MNESSQKIYTELYALLLLSGAILFLAFFPMLFPDAKDTEMATVPDENKIEKVLPDPFRDLDITAQAIYIYDVRNDKVIFEKNGNMQLPLASVTKLMTAIIASESVPEHVVITITPDSLAKEGDTGLFVDEEWDVKDLIEYTLLVSSNDGAYALASVAGANIKYSQLDTEVASDTRIQTHAPKDANEETAKWLEGIEMATNQLEKLLQDFGVKKIESLGQKFNPDFHEALAQDKGEKDIVLEELESGYTLGDKVLRHAKVKVGNGE